MELEETDEEQDYHETVDENQYFSEVFKRYSSPRDFLFRDEKIYLRSAALNSGATDVWLKFQTDIDGCVVELNNLNAVSMQVEHIHIMPRDRGSLVTVKNLLKKHLDLTEYSRHDMSNFSRSVGIQLFYERGWECWIAFIPTPKKANVSLTVEAIRQYVYEVFLSLRSRLKSVLAEYCFKRIARKTLMKNDLNDLKKIFIVDNDSSLILAAVQRALDGFVAGNFRPIIFCFRFGGKMSSGLSLSEFNREGVKKVTVHAAVDISSQARGIDLLWSMVGLQSVVDQRGTLATCLSLTDCGNFQSNLDGRLLDVRRDIRSICRQPDKLKFVQLYADVPHLRPKTRFHPVSGVILGGMCFPKPTANAFQRDAERYISTIDNNWSLMTESTCRLEVVTELPTVTDLVHGTDCLDLDKLDFLLQEKPMLVPVPSTTIKHIRDIGLWLTKELKITLEKFKNTGNIQATWYAFQLELASEKLLWGRPLCAKSYQYSVNLGPGQLGVSRSLTDHQGFLSLERWSACMSTDESVPPYSLWITSEAVGKSIIRAAGFHDHLEGSYPVIGKRLIYALLQDLYEVGRVAPYFEFEKFLLEMKARKTRFQTIGAITTNALCQMLGMKRRLALHMVFNSLCELVEKAGMQLEKVIEAGVTEMKLTHFPAIQTTDANRNPVIRWNLKNNFWKLLEHSQVSDLTETSAALYSDLVRGVLERRGLIYPSKLKKTPMVLPWICCCVKKLERENLPTEAIVNSLAFISCIALMMQGWFVDYDKLALLVSDMPVKQTKLKAFEIQSKLEVANFKFKQLKLYRLHHSIPHQFKIIETETSRLSSGATVQENTLEDFDKDISNMADDDDFPNCDDEIEYRSVTCQAVQRDQKRWSAREVEILHEISIMRPDKSLKEIYSIFREICMKEHILFRTFAAFQRKLKRVET